MTYNLDPLPETATHKDYTRIHFDTANVPAKRIVGLLACQRDPLLHKMRTKVYAAREASVTAPPPPKGKAKQKKGAAPVNGDARPEEKGKLWEVELLDTVIFPEVGGGQPSDTGVIRLLNPNGGVTQEFPVEMCLRKKLDSVHLVRIPLGVEVEGGWEGREVEVETDWDRRFDQMSIHTSQHLISALANTHYGLSTLSWSMQPYPSLDPPYIELARALTVEEALHLEQLCGEAIKQAKKIWVDFSIQGQEAGGELQGEGAVATREFRELPKDYSGGVIRHINIQDTDRNACCGTQSPNLALLSLFHVIPPTPSTSKKDTPTKLLFLSGPRAITALQESSRILSAAARTVGASRADVVQRLERSELARKETSDSLKGVRGELAKLVAEQAIRQGKESQAIAVVSREEKGTHDFEWLGLVGSTYLEAFKNASLEDASSPKPLIVLVSALNPAVSSSVPSQSFLIVQSLDDALAKAVNEKIKTALEGRVKGGGARGKYMSKVDGKWGKAENQMVEEIADEFKKEASWQSMPDGHPL
ncbi:cytoplasmic protein [Cryptococcus wingfieldii CBS 7118]|uniref:Cytoplasmic protein n=1 Tax=Cryptococcus wingfieldii CBS 7118 TaxID=1295528 RepID=A0A1E3IMP2_9TREE|nr:cytoplasmic protein [Cryptococcus wingfieldii CBS 7118]ODN89685.1 cytoplasmic protein [Cryptococcus wingfieldii CBS 7118]